jgi:hypothetical protein
MRPASCAGPHIQSLPPLSYGKPVRDTPIGEDGIQDKPKAETDAATRITPVPGERFEGLLTGSIVKPLLTEWPRPAAKLELR